MKVAAYDISLLVKIPNTTSCKHTTGDCEICGISNKRDILHNTKNGLGKVSSLVKKNKK